MARKPKKQDDEPLPATSLLEFDGIEEDFSPAGGNQTPFDKAYDVLTCTTGPRLEMMTRTTPKLAAAVRVGNTMMWNWGSRYIRCSMDSIMRSHVSMGGRGRTEMVDSLKAGSGVPGEFYNSSNPSLNSYIDIEDEDVPDDE